MMIRKIHKIHGLFIFSLLLAGCAGLPAGENEPPPVSDKGAVVALVDNAKADATSGKLDAAAASLERALRIEPHNPALWQELAKLRLQQRQPDQAASLAAKSNAFAGNNKSLRAGNWRIIGEARAQKGDDQGAQDALNKAAELEK
jgi:tetratricopeptide (TPR) repeat protein